ncbi:MAG TPA: 2'-5' RNA ligase family protein [Bryobacteraceae bacterium]|nr:2'-5' RNA ligase family protein [Bryobacteraceae bacterium]
MESCHSDALGWGCLALVSYIPDPLGTFLHTLRRFLPGEHSTPHITILPPRPLRGKLETAFLEAQTMLRQFPSFEVELSQVKCFPHTNMLYLDVTHGSSQLHQLHSALNTGGLAHTEKFEFLPHLTLGGPVPECSLSAARDQADSAWRATRCSPRFRITEVVCLWLSPTAAWSDWQRISSQSLAVGSRGAKEAAIAAAYGSNILS